MDEEIAAKEEFKKQQGVLAQQFFTQKLRLRATQEKEWTKFNKMCTCTADLFLLGWLLDCLAFPDLLDVLQATQMPTTQS